MEQSSSKESDVDESDIEEEKQKESLINKKKKKKKKSFMKGILIYFWKNYKIFFFNLKIELINKILNHNISANQTSNNLSTPAKPVSNANKDESVDLNNDNDEKNEHTVEDETQITKVTNGTSTPITSVQAVINNTFQQNEQYDKHKEDKNQNMVNEIRDDDEQKKPTFPKTNGNGKVNGKHNSKSNSINHKSKKREMDSSDDLTLNNTKKKMKRLLQS